MKFRLCKNDENKYNHQFVELKNYLKSTFFVNSIIGIIVGFSLISIKFPNEFKNLVVNFKYAISVYFSGYANLSNEDKNLCVSNAYLRIVNNSSKFSEEVKEELVEVSYFLKDYGYLYEADDLINLENDTLNDTLNGTLNDTLKLILSELKNILFLEQKM